jgi:hypothetical protein
MAGQTKVIIASTSTDYTLPGTHWTAQQVANTFADSVPGINSMQSERTEADGDVIYTFRPRTGTKG